MPVFEYEVVDQRGTLGRGSAEAEDQGDLVQQLRGQGQLVLSVRRAPDGTRITNGGRFGLATLREAFSQAMEDAIARGDEALADRGAALMASRSAQEQEVMCGWSPVGR